MEMEWRLVNRYGKVFLEARYKGEPWNELHPWLFPTDTKPHNGWAYMAEFGLYVRNTSIN